VSKGVRRNEESMGIQENIFEQFFKKLEKDEKFPDSVLKELKKLWENGEIASQEKIYEAIKRGCGDANKD
jgi:hypothetical protein